MRYLLLDNTVEELLHHLVDAPDERPRGGCKNSIHQAQPVKCFVVRQVSASRVHNKKFPRFVDIGRSPELLL